MSWVYDKQVTIYSRVESYLRAKLLKKYPNLQITVDDASLTDPQFPTVYINFIGAGERGQTLNGTTVNAVDLTAEAHVLTDKLAGGVNANREVAWTVTDAFKTIGFNATMPNIPTSNVGGVYESVSRFSRIVAQGDDVRFKTK